METASSIQNTVQAAFKFVFVMQKIADRVLKEKKAISSSQFRILMALKRHPDCPQKKIAEFWNMTEASVSRQIELLEKESFITKKQNFGNRRSVILTITPKGEKMLQTSLGILGKNSGRLFSDISEKERKACFHVLTKMFEKAKSEVELFKS